jgi:hypothetical protein
MKFQDGIFRNKEWIHKNNLRNILIFLLFLYLAIIILLFKDITNTLFCSKMEHFITKIVEIYQEHSKEVQILLKDGQIHIKREENKNSLILETIRSNLWKDQPITYQIGNIYQEIQYYWQKIQANKKLSGKKQADNLYHYFAIGLSLKRHQERVFQFDPTIEEDLDELIQDAIKKKSIGKAQRLRRICQKLTELFEYCPQVIPELEEILSYRKIDNMNKKEIKLLRIQIHELLFAVAQS